MPTKKGYRRMREAQIEYPELRDPPINKKDRNEKKCGCDKYKPISENNSNCKSCGGINPNSDI